MKPTAEVSSISNLHIHTSAPWGLVPNHNRQQLVKKLLNGSKCDKRTGPLIKQLSVVSVRIERTLPKRPLEQPEIYLSNNSSQVHINIHLSSHFHNASNTWSLSIPLKVLLGIILSCTGYLLCLFPLTRIQHPHEKMQEKQDFTKAEGLGCVLCQLQHFN